MTRSFERLFGVGFDHLINEIEHFHSTQNNFPPFNVERLGNDRFSISFAVAGFTKDELTVSQDKHVLVVKGNAEKVEKDYVHCGIAKRNFTKRIPLAEYFFVDTVALKNGLLTIEVQQEIPEEAKPKEFKIK